jgi:DNA uptake protein ComE-like DNA-binding protein
MAQRKLASGALLAASAIAIAVAPLASAQDRAQGSPNGSFSSDVNPSGGKTPTKAHPLDLNAASAAELAALPGVGATRAKEIVGNRPYHAKDDLLQRKILPQNVYDQVQDLVIVN